MFVAGPDSHCCADRLGLIGSLVMRMDTHFPFDKNNESHYYVSWIHQMPLVNNNIFVLVLHMIHQQQQ